VVSIEAYQRAGVFCLIAFVSFDLWLRNWGHFFQRHHAWGLGKLGQTVSCAHEAILTDQSPAVLVVSGLAPLVFP